MSSKAERAERRRQAREQAEEVRLEEHRRKLQQLRIDLAKTGIRHFENRKIREAVSAFKAYLHVLEDWKGTPEGGLKPSNFDIKEDTAELLLISGVYWDLVKIYDRSQEGPARREFMAYLEKFIIFSKGMPFQPVCAETLRKYINVGKPIHKKEFKNAYEQITGSKCFVATALMDQIDDRTLPILYRFRDHELNASLGGQVFVRTYYRVGPYLAGGVHRLPAGVQRLLGYGVDLLAKTIAVTFRYDLLEK